MSRWVFTGALMAMALATAAHAQSSFCTGFSAGWAAAFQNHGKIVAITPICPIPAVGGDTYSAGYERGLTAALGYMASHGG
jgi:hypothetical protein